jgi:hypothetical protein
MAANFETLSQELRQLGQLEAAEAAHKAALIPGLPSSVELVRLQEAVLSGETRLQLGLDAREIALSPLAYHANEQGVVTGVGTGDIRTKEGRLLNVSTYRETGDNELVGEPGRLAITIQDPSKHLEFKNPDINRNYKQSYAIAINTNVRSDAFARVYRLRTETPGIRTFAHAAASEISSDPGSDGDYALAEILINRIRDSNQYQAYLAQK